MAEKQFACTTSEVPAGAAKIVMLNNRSVGIFNVNGSYHALLNVCPHRGAALCEGVVSGTTCPSEGRDFVYGRENEIVRCAWHGWEFDIRTGEFLVNPKIKARSYPVSVEDQAIYVHV
jgi:nitrite reductase (NADH) small subunit